MARLGGLPLNLRERIINHFLLFTLVKNKKTKNNLSYDFCTQEMCILQRQYGLDDEHNPKKKHKIMYNKGINLFKVLDI